MVLHGYDNKTKEWIIAKQANKVTSALLSGLARKLCFGQMIGDLLAYKPPGYRQEYQK